VLRRRALLVAALALGCVACGTHTPRPAPGAHVAHGQHVRPPSVHRATATAHVADVYAHDGANMLARAARAALRRVYVPNSLSNTVDVIDPKTDKVIEHFAVGALPEHVVPAWNLKTL
jgi:YVTN family beta-propeller protein